VDGAIDATGDDDGAALVGARLVVAEGSDPDGDGLRFVEPQAARNKPTPPNAAARRSSRREMASDVASLLA